MKVRRFQLTWVGIAAGALMLASACGDASDSPGTLGTKIGASEPAEDGMMPGAQARLHELIHQLVFDSDVLLGAEVEVSVTKEVDEDGSLEKEVEVEIKQDGVAKLSFEVEKDVEAADDAAEDAQNELEKSFEFVGTLDWMGLEKLRTCLKDKLAPFAHKLIEEGATVTVEKDEADEIKIKVEKEDVAELTVSVKTLAPEAEDDADDDADVDNSGPGNAEDPGEDDADDADKVVEGKAEFTITGDAEVQKIKDFLHMKVGPILWSDMLAGAEVSVEIEKDPATGAVKKEVKIDAEGFAEISFEFEKAGMDADENADVVKEEFSDLDKAREVIGKTFMKLFDYGALIGAEAEITFTKEVEASGEVKKTVEIEIEKADHFKLELSVEKEVKPEEVEDDNEGENMG